VEKAKKSQFPIQHWSYSSLIMFLRNPLAWHKQYVEKVYDYPKSPASIIGSAGHVALQHFYSGLSKPAAVELGLEYIRRIADFEIDFGKAVSERAKMERRRDIEEDYQRAIGFYLARAPRYTVLGVEIAAVAEVKGLPLPLKAVSDLVVESKSTKGAVDIIDHKFVESFTPRGSDKPLFILQALFNYYTVQAEFKRPVRYCFFQECKKTRNRDGSSQMRRHVIDFASFNDEFEFFHRLIKDATDELARNRKYLPNPSDLFDGKNSLDIYRLELGSSFGE
jgi:hypothetical protein